MWASENGYFEIVKCFVENGSDQNVKDNNGDTVLDYASASGNFETLKFLMKKNVTHTKSLFLT